MIKEAREELGASEVAMNAKMCTQLAEYTSMLRDYDSAISYYKRVLQYNPNDTHTEIALAKLFMQVCYSFSGKDFNFVMAVKEN